jgi:hypothetical protein
MSDDEIRAVLLGLPIRQLRESGLLARLLELREPADARPEVSEFADLADDQLALQALQLISNSEDLR